MTFLGHLAVDLPLALALALLALGLHRAGTRWKPLASSAHLVATLSGIVFVVVVATIWIRTTRIVWCDAWLVLLGSMVHSRVERAFKPG